MKKRRMVILGGIAILVVTCVLGFWYVRGPTYHGKSVAYWLDRIPDSHLNIEEHAQPEPEFQAMGPSAITHIFNYIESAESRLQKYYRLFCEKLPNPISKKLPAPTKELRDFELLEAKRMKATRGAAALRAIGPAGIPKLAAAFEHGNPIIRETCVTVLRILHREGNEISDLIPDLVGLLSDPDAMVRLRVAQLLGDLGPQAESAIPALIESLDSDQQGRIPSSQVNVRGFAASALVAIGVSTDEVVVGLRNLSESFEIVAERSREPYYKLSMGQSSALGGTIALWELTGEAEYPLRRLIELWTEIPYRSVIPTVRTFGEMGPVAIDAVPLITELLEDLEKPFTNDPRKSITDPRNSGDGRFKSVFKSLLFLEATNALQKIDSDYYRDWMESNSTAP